jgi:hypothetical protein
VCAHARQLVIVKKNNVEARRRELEKVIKILDYLNVATIKQAFKSEGLLFF